MNANLQELHALGQSLWLDNITREMLGDGTMARYIAEYSITGLTSNPTIFEHAIGTGDCYGEQIAELAGRGKSGEELFFELAISDLRRAADMFRPIHDATQGVDGWLFCRARVAFGQGRGRLKCLSFGAEEIRFRTPTAAILYLRYTPLVRAALGPDQARQARDEGRAMTLDEAFDYALAGLPPAEGRAGRSRRLSSPRRLMSGRQAGCPSASARVG